MSKLYVFGDSYSTPNFCVDPKDSWWGLLASALGSKISAVDNYSWGGNNIDSIGHVMINLCKDFKQDDYVAVAIPPLQRLTMFNPNENREYKATLYDAQLREQDQVDVLSHTGLMQYGVHQMDKKFIDLWNPSWIEAQVLRQILTLDSFLKHWVENIIWINSSVPLQTLTQWPVLTTLQKLALEKDNFNLFEKTYYSVNFEKNKPVDFDEWGWMGHQGAVGNHTWYNESIGPMVTKLGWLN
jgi:hypothetical protein